MPKIKKISRERAERIARGHACEHCREYSYKKVTVKEAAKEHRKEFNEAWHATMTCGVCGHENGLRSCRLANRNLCRWFPAKGPSLARAS